MNSSERIRSAARSQHSRRISSSASRNCGSPGLFVRSSIGASNSSANTSSSRVSPKTSARVLARSRNSSESGCAERVAEGGQRRPQTPQPHAHLVDAFGIARFRDGAGVARDVAQAVVQRGAKRFLRGAFGRKLHPARLLRADVAAFERAQAPLALCFRC